MQVKVTATSLIAELARQYDANGTPEAVRFALRDSPRLAPLRDMLTFSNKPPITANPLMLYWLLTPIPADNRHSRYDPRYSLIMLARCDKLCQRQSGSCTACTHAGSLMTLALMARPDANDADVPLAAAAQRGLLA